MQVFARYITEEKKLKNRYCGAFVGDASQVLHHGGIFGYPGTSKSPEGKLRLFFEAIPMSLIFEEAGGKGSNGKGNILDTEAKGVDARTPIFVGNKWVVEELEKRGI